MRYASDNKVVQALYGITTGPYKYLLILLVIVAAGVSLYFPIRDYYVAYRTNDILTRQLQLREAYNESLQSDVDQLLSTEGIEDTARENLGLVKPGETAIDIVGLDDEEPEQAEDAEGADAAADADTPDAADTTADADNPDATNTDAAADAAEQGDAAGADAAGEPDAAAPEPETPAEPTTSAEAEAAERAVVEDAPWYIRLLDAIFFYQGTSGQKVTSTGSSSS